MPISATDKENTNSKSDCYISASNLTRDSNYVSNHSILAPLNRPDSADYYLTLKSISYNIKENYRYIYALKEQLIKHNPFYARENYVNTNDLIQTKNKVIYQTNLNNYKKLLELRSYKQSDWNAQIGQVFDSVEFHKTKSFR